MFENLIVIYNLLGIQSLYFRILVQVFDVVLLKLPVR